MMDAVSAATILALLTCVGAVVGSFLTVVVARVPTGSSVVSPRSRCMACGASVRWFDNVPVLSWLVLQGRCRTCRAPIAVRYPLIELTSALTWLILAGLAITDAIPLATLPLLLVVASGALALVAIDLEHLRLPDPILGVTAAAALGTLVPVVWLSVHPLATALGIMGGASIWTLVLACVWAISRGRAMGFGDVKLAPILGGSLGALGLGPAIVGLFAAFMTGALIGAVLLARGRVGRGQAIAFGPFLVLGWAIGVLIGQPATRWYLEFLLGVSHPS